MSLGPCVLRQGRFKADNNEDDVPGVALQPPSSAAVRARGRYCRLRPRGGRSVCSCREGQRAAVADPGEAGRARGGKAGSRGAGRAAGAGVGRAQRIDPPRGPSAGPGSLCRRRHRRPPATARSRCPRPQRQPRAADGDAGGPSRGSRDRRLRPWGQGGLAGAPPGPLRRRRRPVRRRLGDLRGARAAPRRPSARSLRPARQRDHDRCSLRLLRRRHRTGRHRRPGRRRHERPPRPRQQLLRPAAPSRRAAGFLTWAGRRSGRRGPGDAADPPRPGAARAPGVRHRLRKRRILRREHRSPGGAGIRRRGRSRRDRRRCRLSRRAVLPRRTGGGGDRQGHLRRRHLPDRCRQRQPLRQQRARNRLLGSPRISRLGCLPGGGRRAEILQRQPLHGLRPRVGDRPHLRDHDRTRRNPVPGPAVGGTLERCPHRPRRGPPQRLGQQSPLGLGRRKQRRKAPSARSR